MKYCFTNVFSKKEDPTKSTDYSIMKNKCASYVTEIDQCTHLFSYNFNNGLKMKKARSSDKKILHMKWITYSAEYFTALRPQSFDLLDSE